MYLVFQWYATNVHYSHKNLIPIPLGLANDHPKNLSYINYINNNNLIKGFTGGYHYRRLQVSGERYDEKPNKNRFSHIHDALQYLLLGAGEGRTLTMGNKSSKPIIAKRNFNVFNLKPKSIYERRR